MSQSLCLHDEGEENWPIKIHIGCGGIFLDGYINTDVDGVLAIQNPINRRMNTTVVSDYYARLEGDKNHLPTRRVTVVDCKVEATHLEYQENTVDKIIAIQVLEHLTPVMANRALRHWHTILKLGHPLVLSVPDMEGTLDLLATDFEFAVRHLRGREGDWFNSHHAWYTRDTLTELLMANRFRVDVLPNPHFYPAICVRAIKE